VVLWELFSYGDNPFPSVPLQSLYHTLCGGYQMPRPDGASDEMLVYCSRHPVLYLLKVLTCNLEIDF